MLTLPDELLRRLKIRFPHAKDRTRFVEEAVDDALDRLPQDNVPSEFVGGTLHLFTDGGSRGNPGQAAIGCVLEDPVEGKVLEEHGEVIGIETNNVAEYRALITGLKLAQRYHPNRLICHLDSELIVRQLNGQYQVKMPTLKAFVDEIQQLCSDLPDVVFQHIPRADNFRADALVNRSLDAAGYPKSLPRRLPPHVRHQRPRPTVPPRRW